MRRVRLPDLSRRTLRVPTLDSLFEWVTTIIAFGLLAYAAFGWWGTEATCVVVAVELLLINYWRESGRTETDDG